MMTDYDNDDIPKKDYEISMKDLVNVGIDKRKMREMMKEKVKSKRTTKSGREAASGKEFKWFEKEINGTERSGGRKGCTLVLTIDSGASENVIGDGMVLECPLLPSSGRKAGVKYVTANGTEMPNRGEQMVRVQTPEGAMCLLKMQVTDVRKPLMSVAKMCDAGHRVTFSSHGGRTSTTRRVTL